LLELSKKYEDVVISVTDADGQFLLIEAALAIPSWLKPSNSNNRVSLALNKRGSSILLHYVSKTLGVDL
jgi:hypothetical protein